MMIVIEEGEEEIAKEEIGEVVRDRGEEDVIEAEFDIFKI